MKHRVDHQFARTITIDAPIASGKSGTGASFAKRLGYLHVDSGKIYNALTREVLRRQVDPTDGAAVAAVAHDMRYAASLISDGESVLWANREKMSDLMFNTPEINSAVSIVSAHLEVRDIIREKQRLMIRLGGFVLTGHDVGTMVAPEAQVKIFLDVPMDIRAKRRQKFMRDYNPEVTLEAAQEDLEARDRIDMNIYGTPLQPAENAIIFKYSGTFVKETVNLLMELVQKA